MVINKTVILSFLLIVLSSVVSSTRYPFRVTSLDFSFCPINFENVSIDSSFISFSNLIDPSEYIIQNSIEGYSYLDQPKAFYAGFFLDEFINKTVFDGYARQKYANVTGAEILGTYLCSYSFFKDNLMPCNILCESLIHKVQPFTYKNISIIPTLEECLADGTYSNNNCSAFGLIGLLSNFKPIPSIPPQPTPSIPQPTQQQILEPNSALFSKKICFSLVLLFIISLILTN